MSEREAQYVAGPVWQDPDGDGDDGPLWTAEVQTMGGYAVVATVHGSTEQEATERRDRTLAALAMPDREAIADPWQPIETAPTNASVLVFIPNAEHYGHGVYRAMLVDMGTGRRWMTTGYAIGRDCPVDGKPTHWQPLPAAPLALTVGGGQ